MSIFLKAKNQLAKPFNKLNKLINGFFSVINKKFYYNFTDIGKSFIKFEKIAKKIIALEDEYKNLTNEELRNKTVFFKQQLSEGKTLDDILIEAFATVKEASNRTLKMMHFKEQLIAGIALHHGMITEMKTGEGKTLAATLPSYLNALNGPVHIVTVNDYLAKRDSDEMGKIHRFLGISVGCILEALNEKERQNIYACDIVYATNNQLGFDYLKDNMKYNASQVCMRGLNYALIDEADSVLIDEARTPLIISGEDDQDNSSFSWISDLILQLTADDYEKDEKMRTVTLTDSGIEKIENLLILEGMLNSSNTLYEVENIQLVHAINQSLKAHMLFKKDIDYIVKNNKIMLIDEFTGRILEGRRYSDGLHQALEAKEKVEVQAENKTHASITFQKFFALYNKISGMSGTCIAESEEFKEIYNCPTIEIPTHKKMIREDLDDQIYRTFEEKFEAIVKEVTEAHNKQQPILLITGSIEASDIFSARFHHLGLKHNILNARKHKEEAEIIADAGLPGAITIATNMAGRGTDIQLGGNLSMKIKLLQNKGLSEAEINAKIPEIEKEIKQARNVVIKAGGLYVVGTERNESRRVDDQARGRSGRQGDIGSSKFFLSLEDDLMRIFGSSSNLDKWLLRFGMEYGEEIKHPFITKAIFKAQATVEARNFDSRKNVFKYDQVLDEQRKMIYTYRNKFLYNENLEEQIKLFALFELNKILDVFYSQENVENYFKDIHQELNRLFGLNINLESIKNEIQTKEEAFAKLEPMINAKFNMLKEKYGQSYKMIMLNAIDDLWQHHLSVLEALRQSVNLKSYAQKDPLNEYKKEGFTLFENLLENFRSNTLTFIFHMPIESSNEPSEKTIDI